MTLLNECLKRLDSNNEVLVDSSSPLFNLLIKEIEKVGTWIGEEYNHPLITLTVYLDLVVGSQCSNSSYPHLIADEELPF